MPLSSVDPMSSLVACHSEKLRLLGICTSKPKFPDYATLASRINSFKYWPNTTNNVDEFAEAGLFITGTEDQMQCFYCGVVLCGDWSPSDHPWVEHCRSSFNCDFVRLCKGDGFIQSVRDNISDDIAGVNNFTSNNNENNLNCASSNAAIVDVLNESMATIEDLNEKIPSWTGDENVRSAVDMGYDERLIGWAIISHELTMFESMEELVERIESLRPSWEKMKLKGSKLDALPSTSVINAMATADDQKLCRICMDADVSIVFLPCAHLVSCPNCSPALQHCPLCRTEAVARLRVFTT